MVILVLVRNGWRLISTIKYKKSRHIVLSFDGARRESGLGAAAGYGMNTVPLRKSPMVDVC